MADKCVLIDTSAWMEYLRKSPHPITKEVESSLVLNTAITCQLVLAELLQGAKSEKELDLIKDLASVVKIAKEAPHTWIEAGILSNRARKQGKILSLIDCYLAVLAEENKARLLTLDKHFSAIADLV